MDAGGRAAERSDCHASDRKAARRAVPAFFASLLAYGHRQPRYRKRLPSVAQGWATEGYAIKRRQRRVSLKYCRTRSYLIRNRCGENKGSQVLPRRQPEPESLSRPGFQVHSTRLTPGTAMTVWSEGRASNPGRWREPLLSAMGLCFRKKRPDTVFRLHPDDFRVSFRVFKAAGNRAVDWYGAP